MKERPILFSGEMVRAILEGRKSQTRRLFKQPKWAMRSDRGDDLEGDDPMMCHERSGCLCRVPCPYGKPGDRLWVKETWQLAGWDWEDCDQNIRYRADGKVISQTWPEDRDEESYDWLLREVRIVEKTPGAQWVRSDGIPVAADEAPEGSRLEHDVSKQQWRGSIFMPRWCSRIDLEVVGVRVERLQSMTEADAKAEGVKYCCDLDPIDSYVSLWESINGKGSWAANPWVWVVEFRRHVLTNVATKEVAA